MIIDLWNDRLKWWRSHSLLCVLWVFSLTLNALYYFMYETWLFFGITLVLDVCFVCLFIQIVVHTKKIKAELKMFEEIENDISQRS